MLGKYINQFMNKIICGDALDGYTDKSVLGD